MHKPSVLFSIMAAMLAAEISRENMDARSSKASEPQIAQTIDPETTEAERIKADALRSVASELSRL